MILDALECADRYTEMHPSFAAAFAFLRSIRGRTLTPGRHEIDGDRVFALISADQGKSAADARLEAHRKHIDIQYVVSGRENMGWRNADECGEILKAFNSETDIMFFADDPAVWVTVPPGSFAIFFPSDAHAPMVSGDLISKVVVKVRI
jgi:biofilm protein TabA